MVMKGKEKKTKLLRVNVDKWSCDMCCEDCYRFFECPLPRKPERYQKRMEAIADNLANVKHIIPVLSGKGGVGKSIVSANLATGLAARGYSVSIVDSDLHGPSIPSILGIEKGYLLSGPNGMVPPQTSLGVKVVSTDFLFDDSRPVTWLSNLKRSAQEQFLANTDYGPLDYLIIDMPPGTGSETVNLLKYLPQMSGVIIVTMSSDIVEQVVHRCIALCKKANVPIIGMIENMNSIVCPHCNESYMTRNAATSSDLLADETGVPLLGKIARDPLIVEAADNGQSFLLAYPESEVTENFYTIISKVEEALSSHRPGSAVASKDEPEKEKLSRILEINYDPSCQGKGCLRCTDYFQCTLPKKENIHETAMLKKIQNAMSGIRHKVAVMSCKGGVGKSTLSVNLAVALAQKGKSAVILDCDFHGPCVPKMLGVKSEGMIMDKDGVVPVPGAANVSVVSMDFLIQPHEALTWFDPLKKMTVAQFLYSVDYGEKDFLIIDLPPGTGAESYALLQYVPDLDGTVIVTLPSESPQSVASKSIDLCRQAKVPVLGIIENMSYFVCSNCQQTSKLCGTKEAEHLADRMEVPFLGNIPLDSNIFMNCDDGVPFVVKSPQSIAARSVLSVANKIIESVEGR